MLICIDLSFTQDIHFLNSNLIQICILIYKTTYVVLNRALRGFVLTRQHPQSSFKKKKKNTRKTLTWATTPLRIYPMSITSNSNSNNFFHFYHFLNPPQPPTLSAFKFKQLFHLYPFLTPLLPTSPLSITLLYITTPISYPREGIFHCFFFVFLSHAIHMSDHVS